MASKDHERTSRQEAAARMGHLREVKFETAGFKPGEKITMERAHEMIGYNRRQYGNLRPIPSVKI